MIKQRLIKRFLLVFLTTISLSNISAQNKNLTIIDDPRVDQLLNEKKKINPSLTLQERYQIQIFSGSSEIAKKQLTEFKTEYKEVDATLFFQTPNYKVWVGNFRTRMEAEKKLMELQKKYKNAFLIKPSK